MAIAKVQKTASGNVQELWRPKLKAGKQSLLPYNMEWSES